MPSEKLTNILILGGSGFIGQRLRVDADDKTTIATYNSNPFKGGIAFDPMQNSLFDYISSKHRFSHAILLNGDTQPDSCIADPTKSHQTNVLGLKKIVNELIELRIKPVFTSTEFVFDGKDGNYSEADPARPILLYGAQKLEIEEYLRENCEDYVIFRLAKVFGDGLFDNTLFSEWACKIRAGNEKILCAQDQAFSPIFIGDVIKALHLAVSQNLSGLFHLSGGKRYTRIECLDMFLSKIKSQNNLSCQIEPCSINDFNLPEQRPLDVSMVIDKLELSTNYKPSDIENLCQHFVHRWL